MRRLIRSGELFTEDELETGAELETVPPVVNASEYEQNEPWAVTNGDD